VKKTFRKRLINWIVLCGIFGALSLVFDQFAIQQESEIRRLDRLSIQTTINNQMLTDYNNHLRQLVEDVLDFVIQSTFRRENFYQAESIRKLIKDNKLSVEEEFFSESILIKDVEYFSKEYLTNLKENHQKLYELGFMTERTKQIVESIVSQSFNIGRKNITFSEYSDAMSRLVGTTDDLGEIINYTARQGPALGKEFLDLSRQASLKRSYKQRFLLLGTISQIISLMFLLIFFRALYTIQTESGVEIEPEPEAAEETPTEEPEVETESEPETAEETQTEEPEVEPEPKD